MSIKHSTAKNSGKGIPHELCIPPLLEERIDERDSNLISSSSSRKPLDARESDGAGL